MGKIRGMSLVSVLVAAAVGGIVMAALSQLISNSLKGAKAVESSLNRSEIERSINTILANADVCSSLIVDGGHQTFNPTPGSQTPIRFGVPTSPYTLRAGYVADNSLRINTLNFMVTAVIRVPAPPTTTGIYLGDIIFATEKLGDQNAMGGLKKETRIPIFIWTTAPAGPGATQIERCCSSTSDTDPVPAIYSISPQRASPQGGYEIIITGSNFTPVTEVMPAGWCVAPVVLSPIQIKCTTIRAGAEGEVVPVQARTAAGDSNQSPFEYAVSVTPYPSSCRLTIKQKDFRNNPAKPTYESSIMLDKAGYAGLNLSGDVNADDRLWIEKTGCSTLGKTLDAYVATCELGFGQKDNSQNPPLAPHANPDIFVTQFGADPSAPGLNLVGDLDSNDSVYFRMRCPATGDPLLRQHELYLKGNCFLCFGQSDWNRPQITSKACKRIQDNTDNTWGRFLLEGGVDNNDNFFLGFYCSNESGSVVRNMVWTDN